MLLAAAASLLLLLEWGFGTLDPAGKAPVKGYTDLTLTGLAENYQHALAQFDYNLASADERSASMPNDWLLHNVSARAWLAKARLTGSYSDYLEAERAVSEAFRVAGPGTGPHMTGAVIAFAMHRLDQAESFLNATDRYAVPPDRDEQAEIAAMRGDIAFYRGRYAQAVAGYDKADTLAPGASNFRRAVYYSLTGRPDLAELYLDRTDLALRNPTRHARAKLELQRGTLDLDRERLDDALVHFRRADRVFPGYWLIEEHIAEVLTLKGEVKTAERMYRDIIRRTGHPEFMDALAGIAATSGREVERRAWFAKADKGWRLRLKQFPEAAYGHAIEHCRLKADWPCALALAHRNHQTRAYGEASIKLAQALLASGRKDDARNMIEAVLASPWRTLDLHRTAADIYAALARNSDAAKQNRLAREFTSRKASRLP